MTTSTIPKSSHPRGCFYVELVRWEPGKTAFRSARENIFSLDPNPEPGAAQLMFNLEVSREKKVPSGRSDLI